ncbi:MAG TPA: DUF2950 domain-containing protein [Opitutaceae bacterium]|nr:DUF2950 domain-containing protein [Opitutaceae bacterium]
MMPLVQMIRSTHVAAGVLAFVAGAAVLSLRAESAGPAGSPQSFGSPEEAVKALVAATKAGDRAAVDVIFGPEVKDLLSGDPKQDALEFATFAKLVGQYSQLVQKADDRFVLNLGDQNWPFPIPLVKKNGAWIFDTAAGREEIINRRVGEDELIAIGVCRTYLAAQREYASEDRAGDGVLKFAQKLRSSPGQKDGLYWPAAPDEEQSPFGPLIAEIRTEGYGGKTAEGNPQPFHGYHFKILTAQGASAPGGRYSYIINGNMIAGFALVAYPAHWGESGIMTFVVNQWGKVYERNLGPSSAEIAAAMTEFDPDRDWTVVKSP